MTLAPLTSLGLVHRNQSTRCDQPTSLSNQAKKSSAQRKTSQSRDPAFPEPSRYDSGNSLQNKPQCESHDAPNSAPIRTGSFDFRAASLREAVLTLRMTHPLQSDCSCPG